MDLAPHPMLRDQPVIIGGETREETYGEFQAEMDLINRAFAEVMLEGDAKGRVFTFPIPTYNIGKDFDWENPDLAPIWRMAAKYGIPYFANFVNSDMQPEDARSMCPLAGHTEVVVRSKQEGIRVEQITRIINNMTIKGTEYEVLTPSGYWAKAKPVKVPATEVYRIWFTNTFVDMGKNHLQPTLEHGTLPARKLTVDMWLPFTKSRFEGGLGSYIDHPEQPNAGACYKEDDTYHYYRITKIEQLTDCNAEHLYCFEVNNDEHLFTLANGLVTHNCRLRLDQRELRKRMGGLFAAAPLTGSVGVVTMNLARLGYLARDEADFRQRLERLMYVARISLEIKRKMLETFTERGLYPYSHHYLRGVKAQTGGYWNNHFSTIGLNGMHEASLNLLGVGIDEPDGRAFAVRTLAYMRDVLAHYQEETGNLYNLEATPAEGATYRLARIDKERYPDIRTAGSETAPYYTNSTHLPVAFSDDLFDVLDHQDDLQTLYTGGTVLHIFLGEQLDDWRQARRLVRAVAENYRLPYYTLTPTFSVCPVHGYIPGEHPFCPYEHTEEQLKQFGRRVVVDE
jgi:ribonucleoside-triphosphate reductase